jgi:hypothetical protein
VIAAFAAIGLLALTGCGPRLGEIEGGPLFLLPREGGPLVLTVTRRERKLRRGWAEDVGVEVRDAATLRLLAREELASGPARGNPGVEVIGATASRIWLWHEGVRGYDAATLAPVAGPDAIGERNPPLASVLPGEPRYVAVSLDGSALELRARDGTRWRVDGDSLRASPIEPGAPERDPFHFVGARGPFQAARPLSFGDLGYDAALLERVWVGALAEQDAGAPVWWSGRASAPQGEQRRRLYGAPYERDPAGGESVRIGAKAPLGRDLPDFLDGALLREGAAWHALRLADPESVVVIAKSELGAAGRLVLSRVAAAGELVWTRELPLVEAQWFAVQPPALVMLGVEPGHGGASERPKSVAAVDLRDGRLAVATLGSDD